MLLQTSLNSQIWLFYYSVFLFNNVKSNICLRRMQICILQFASAKAQCTQNIALKSFTQDIWQILYKRQHVDEKVKLRLFTALYRQFPIDWGIPRGDMLWCSEQVGHLLLPISRTTAAEQKRAILLLPHQFDLISVKAWNIWRIGIIYLYILSSQQSILKNFLIEGKGG